MDDSVEKSGQAGTVEKYGKRGVWVPEGMSAADIMAGAQVLERDFGITPFTSREAMRAILSAIRPANSGV